MTVEEMRELVEGDRVMVRPSFSDMLFPATFLQAVCEMQPSAENPEREEPSFRAVVRYGDGELDEIDFGQIEPSACEHEWVEKEHPLVGIWRRCQQCRAIDTTPVANTDA